MNQRYFNSDNWHEIEKQSIFEAWVPYTINRPLEYFIPLKGKEKVGFLSSVIDDRTIFPNHKIVTNLSRRKVIILTSDELSKDPDYPDILVAKIVTIKPHHKNNNWYNLLCEDRHSLFVHLPEYLTGKESYVNIAQVITIGKKMLIQKKGLLPKDRMKLVEDRLERCIDLGIIKSEDYAVND